MANTLVDMFRMKDIRKKIFFTFAILAVTRIGASLPIPGVNPGAVLSYFESNSNSFTEYLNFFSGGAFANFSIFMLGVMPYISTQIIIQLLMLVVPSLKKLAQDPQGAQRRFSSILVTALSSLQQSSLLRHQCMPEAFLVRLQSVRFHSRLYQSSQSQLAQCSWYGLVRKSLSMESAMEYLC